MHTEVLTKEQKELLPLIKLFSKEYYLVEGTAMHWTNELFNGFLMKNFFVNNCLILKM